jgi:SHS2 domain-containing protein
MATGEQKRFEFIDHTGDIGIRVFGENREEIFQHAAEALFEVITDLDTIEPRETMDITVEADGWKSLLVSWLSEFIYLLDTRQMLFRDFTVLSLNENRITATACGEPYNEDKHLIKTTVKGATYHQLRIFREEDRWVGEVILDI